MEISLIYDQWSWREKVARDVCSVMYINMTCTQNAYNAYNLLCTWSRYSHIKTALYLLISYGWMHYLHMHYATMQLTVEKCKWKKSLKTQVKNANTMMSSSQWMQTRSAYTGTYTQSRIFFEYFSHNCISLTMEMRLIYSSHLFFPLTTLNSSHIFLIRLHEWRCVQRVHVRFIWKWQI